MWVNPASVPMGVRVCHSCMGLESHPIPPYTECPASPCRLSWRRGWTLDLEKLDSVPPRRTYVSSGLSALI